MFLEPTLKKMSLLIAAMIVPMILMGCSAEKPPATSTPEQQKSMMDGMKGYEKKGAAAPAADKAAEKK